MLLLFSTTCGYVCHSPSLLIGPLTAENGVTRCFTLPFCSQICQKIFPTYSESSSSDGSNHTKLALNAYPELSHHYLKMQKCLVTSSLAPETNGNLLDRYRHTEPKLVWLEPSGHEEVMRILNMSEKIV